MFSWQPKKVIIYLSGTLFVATLFYQQACNLGQNKGKAEEKSFAGTHTCISCHEKEYLAWSGSDHDLAMAKADSQTVLGNFNNVTYAADGVTSRFYQEDGHFYVHTEGPTGAYEDFKIEYTFGLRPLQQYLVQTSQGKYQTLRTSWDTEKREWFHQYNNMRIPHDDWLHWTGGGQNWNSMCADCHSTNIHKNYFESSDSFATIYSIINVSCEACHGHGFEHVRYMNARITQDLPDDYDGREHELLLTVRDTSKLQVDQCARCHSRRAQITSYYDFSGPFMDHYIPDILRDNIYFPDGQIMDEDYVYGSFVQSQMYHEHVKCTDCHDAHALKLKAEENLLCLNCHAKEDYDTPDHHFHEMNTVAALCVSCHMTGRVYMGNDFRRDHSFRIPRPDQSVMYNTPNACTGCHENETDQWAADAVVKWYGKDRAYHFSDALTMGSSRSPEAVPKLVELVGKHEEPDIARATAIWYLGQIGTPVANETVISALSDKSPKVRIEAMNALMNLQLPNAVQLVPPLLRDSIRGVRITAANVLADVDERLLGNYVEDLKNALQEYQNYLEINAEFPSGQIIKGQFHERIEETGKAEYAYKKALEKDKLAHMANLNLATLYSRQGRQNKALESLQMIISLDSTHGQAHYSLGLLYAELNQFEQAQVHMQKAAQQMPENPRVYYNWGLLLQNLNKNQVAERIFQQGLEYVPEAVDLEYALCLLWIQTNQLAKARPLANRLASQFPNNPNIQGLLNYIQ